MLINLLLLILRDFSFWRSKNNLINPDKRDVDQMAFQP